MTQVNEQLRKINRELEELKDRYTDLYENSPAMYFSLDTQGKVIECNQTMLTTLKLSRDEVVGHPYDKLLHEPRAEGFSTRFQAFMEKGSVEKETCWVKPNGELIDVWVIGKVVAGSKGSVAHTRFVAQDITVNRLLEAELQEKNQRLAEANRRAFAAEPRARRVRLRRLARSPGAAADLIAFSDFLLKDYGDGSRPKGRNSCGIWSTPRAGCGR